MTKANTRPLPLYAMIVFIALTASLLGTYGITADIDRKPVNSESEAVAVCNDITGFNNICPYPKTDGYRPTAVNCAFVDTTTPFIHSSLNGRPSWRISCGQLDLTLNAFAH